MKTFYKVLGNALTASLTNMFVWFAVTFWVYLQTRSVVATSIMAGVYLATIAVSGFFLGSIVDHNPKKRVMLGSTSVSLGLYIAAFAIYSSTPIATFKDPHNPKLWAFIILCLLGAIAGNIRNIALSTLVTILIPEGERDKANGMVGTTTGISFLICSMLSGLVIGYLGMWWMLIIALTLTILALFHMASIQIEENFEMPKTEDGQSKVDVKGTIRIVGSVPGLFGLIFFTTFNNFLGGAFMSLMDAYGLEMMDVKAWGLLWSLLSTGFIVGGLIVSKKGLGPKPLRTLFICNLVSWGITCIFTIQPSIILLAVGMFTYLCLIPACESAEQTILQRVIPLERQGRVFGFAQSVEQAASPVTAFLVGPLASAFFIPFMTNGSGVHLIGGWFGTGKDRGIALLFTLVGFVGLAMTIFAMRSSAYRHLSKSYEQSPEVLDQEAPVAATV